MIAIMQDRVGGGYSTRFKSHNPASIHVPVKAGKVAAADLQAQPVAGTEYIARGPEIDDELISLLIGGS